MDGLTRGQFLRAAVGTAGTLALGAGRASGTPRASGAPFAARVAPAAHEAARAAPRVLAYHSRPDLRPPPPYVANATAPATAYAFLGPTSDGKSQAGPLIVDSAGQPVWFNPIPSNQLASNVRVQEYQGKPVITWWQGTVLPTGYGRGEGIIVDTSYRPVAQVRAAHGRSADLHEFLLTPQGTALITCYPQLVPMDLSRMGGPKNGHVMESVIQEIDVRTGRLLLEWDAMDHIALAESHASPSGYYGFDYLHANSIDLASDGNLLVSGRHTWAIYKIGRGKGELMWRLGGKRSDFALGKAARFSWQHDARQPAPGVITVFDDGEGLSKTETQSRGMMLAVNDGKHRSARLTQSFRHPKPLLASAMGSAQVLANGNVAIGWGTVPWLSEFAPTGQLLSDLLLPWGCTSYRGLRFDWQGTPVLAPSLVGNTNRSTGATSLYASWNGATDVAGWLVSVGPGASALKPVTITARTGFETAIAVGTASGYAAVTALSASGQALGTSAPIRV